MSGSGIIMGRLRGAARVLMGGMDEVAAQMADGGEIVVAQGLPPETELARLGLIRATVGSAVTAVAAIPTTGAHLSLYNGSAKSSLVICAAGAVETTSSAAAGQAVLLARNDVPGANANPAGTVAIFGTDGRNYGGDANAKASVTLAAIAANNNVGWVPVGASAVRTTTTGVGVNQHSECFGRWIVRPSGMFSLAVLAQTAAGSFQPYIFFAELQLNNP